MPGRGSRELSGLEARQGNNLEGPWAYCRVNGGEQLSVAGAKPPLLPRWLSGEESAGQRRRPPAREDPTPVLLPGKSHGQRSLVDCSPWGHKRVGHDLASKQQQQNRPLSFFIWRAMGSHVWRALHFQGSALALVGKDGQTPAWGA